MGRILIESRVPDGVELHLSQLARHVEDAYAIRVSKLGDKSGRNGQYQFRAGQNARPQHVVRHDDRESSYEAVHGFERTTLSGSDQENIAHGNAERLLHIS